MVLIETAFSAWHNLCASRDEVLAESSDDAGIDPRYAERYACVDRIACECGLTAREHELLDYMSRGYGAAYIAKKLFISPSTVRTHFKHIYRKVGVTSRESLLVLIEERTTHTD